MVGGRGYRGQLLVACAVGISCSYLHVVQVWARGGDASGGPTSTQTDAGGGATARSNNRAGWTARRRMLAAWLVDSGTSSEG